MNPLNRFWPRRDRRPDPEPLQLDEAAKERLVMTALEGIAAGWTAVQLQAHLGPSRDDRAFEGWLANFAYRRWFPDPAAHGEVAQGLVQWGELDDGGLGKATRAIGRELQHHASLPTPEVGATAMPSAAAPPPELGNATEDGAALVALGEQAFNLGSYEVALRFYDQALQRQPDLAEAWLKRGNVLDALGRYREAVQSYERYGIAVKSNLVSSAANDFNTLFDEGNALLNLGNYEEAIAAYDAALTIKPDKHDALNNKGVALVKLGRYEEAIIAYDAALMIKPDKHEALNNKGAVLCDFLGRFEEAIVAFDAALAIKPDDHRALTNKRVALFELGRYEDIIASYNAALSIKPNDYITLINTGNALFELGRYEEVIATYSAALAIKPDDNVTLTNKGCALFELGRYEDAISDYDAALTIKPDYHPALYSKGLALRNSGCYAEAIVAYDAALAIKPGHHDTLFNKGVALFELGRYEDEIAAYDAVLTIKPDNHQAFTHRGGALFELEQFEDAISDYDAALEIKPDNHEALNGKGMALTKLGRYEEALSYYDAVLAIKPDYLDALGNKGTALSKLGRYEKAISYCDAALSLKPDLSGAWLNRGIAAGRSWQAATSMRSTLPLAIQDAALDQRGYAGRIACYQAGLQQVTATADPLGWGRLHLAMGRAHFAHHRFTEEAHRYARLALDEYAQALITLTAYPEEHLKVLQDSIRAHLLLGQHPQARQQREEGLALLRDLINRHPQRRQQLEQQFSGFSQLGVDLLLQEGSPIAALEAAERYKNRALTWLLDALGETTVSPSLEQIATLLHPGTALVMWHLSPDALTHFVLLPGHPDPIATSQPTGELERWLKAWDGDYGDYRSKGKASDGSPRQRHPWRKELSNRLDDLADRLDIPSLSTTLAEAHITHLILIPHGDLHRLPLHTCFGDGYTSHTLPSAQLGLTLQSRPSDWPLAPQSPLLSIESPSHHGLAPLLFAEIESALLCQLFPPRQRLSDSEATAASVTAALTTGALLIHFTGHGLYQERAPQDSALFLAGDDTLTVQTLRQLSLDACHLISLAACETALTRQETLSADYVGLASAFLQAGASTVLSTLWTVESISSAWFIVYFYEQLRAGHSPALALHQTQTWLRTVTPATLRPWLQAHLTPALQTSDPGAYEALDQEIERLSTLTDTIGATQPPYDDPYYWAAFVLTGRGHESL
jgi:tetratricopeptide (TPR) repeat protein/CHAT domain-containing protein